MGLNGILANALESLSMDNNLVSWNIFNEKSGHISVKIRFRSVSDSFSHDEETHYRKKPWRQVQRDREHGQAWRAAKHSDNKQAGPVTGKTVGADKPADHISRSGNSPGIVSSIDRHIVTRSMTRLTIDTPENLRHCDPLESPHYLSLNPTATPLNMDNSLSRDISLLSSGMSDGRSPTMGVTPLCTEHKEINLAENNIPEYESDSCTTSLKSDDELIVTGIEQHALEAATITDADLDNVYPFGISGPSAQEMCDIIRSELREQTSQILTVLDPPDPVALILDS